MEESETKNFCDPLVPGQCKCEGLLNNLFLDTQGYCFVCLKEIGSCNNVNRNKEVEFCLRNINRYFNIDSTSLLLSEIEALEEESGSSLRDAKFDLSVNLCDSCYMVGGNLSALICQLEKTESLLNCQLQTLQKSLEASHQEGSEGADVLWKKIQEKMVSGGGDPAEALVVGQLRQEIKEKCYQKIDKYHVSNSKLDDGGLPASAPSLPVTDQTDQLDLTFSTDQDTPLNAAPTMTPCGSRDEEAGMDFDLDRINDNTLSPEKMNDHPEPAGTLSPVAIQTQPLASNSFDKNTPTNAPPPLHPYKTSGRGAQNKSTENLSSNHKGTQPKELSSKQFVLDVCRNQCTRIQVDGNIRNECAFCKQIFQYPRKTREHLAFAHPEKFFRLTKLPHLSAEDLKENCKNVLLAETIKQVVRQSATFSKSKVVFCRVCNKRCQDKRGLIFHLILKHYGFLEDKLMNVKTKMDTDDNNVYQTQNIPKKYIENHQSKFHRSSSVVCNFCHRSLSNKLHLRRHQEGACPGAKLRRFWTCNVTSGGCGAKLPSSYGLARHKRLNCPGRKSHITSQTAKTFVSINSRCKRRTCDKCNRKFHSRNLLLKHKKMKNFSQINDGNNMLDRSIPTHQKSLPLPEIQPNHGSINDSTEQATSSNMNTEKANEHDVEEWDKETLESVTCFCGKPFAGRKMIECQKCLVWYHFSCVGIHEQIPPNFQFQCSLCKNFLE